MHDSHVFAHTTQTAGNIVQKYSAQKKHKNISLHKGSKPLKKKKLADQHSDSNPPCWTDLPPLPLTKQNLQLHNTMPQSTVDQASETDFFQHVDSVSEFQTPSSPGRSSVPHPHRCCSPPKKVYSKHQKHALPSVYNP